jgi:hypothetical protein
VINGYKWPFIKTHKWVFFIQIGLFCRCGGSQLSDLLRALEQLILLRLSGGEGGGAEAEGGACVTPLVSLFYPFEEASIFQKSSI